MSDSEALAAADGSSTLGGALHSLAFQVDDEMASLRSQLAAAHGQIGSLKGQLERSDSRVTELEGTVSKTLEVVDEVVHTLRRRTLPLGPDPALFRFLDLPNEIVDLILNKASPGSLVALAGTSFALLKPAMDQLCTREVLLDLRSLRDIRSFLGNTTNKQRTARVSPWLVHSWKRTTTFPKITLILARDPSEAIVPVDFNGLYDGTSFWGHFWGGSVAKAQTLVINIVVEASYTERMSGSCCDCTLPLSFHKVLSAFCADTVHFHADLMGCSTASRRPLSVKMPRYVPGCHLPADLVDDLPSQTYVFSGCAPFPGWGYSEHLQAEGAFGFDPHLLDDGGRHYDWTLYPDKFIFILGAAHRNDVRWESVDELREDHGFAIRTAVGLPFEAEDIAPVYPFVIELWVDSDLVHLYEQDDHGPNMDTQREGRVSPDGIVQEVVWRVSSWEDKAANG